MGSKRNKTIGVIGTRRRDSGNDFHDVFIEFRELYKDGDCICSGLCPEGGDRFAVIIADIYRIPEHRRIWFPADWKTFGKAAGFIRNTDIAENSDYLIACVAKDRKGGTEDTIKKWKKSHRKKRRLIIV